MIMELLPAPRIVPPGPYAVPYNAPVVARDGGALDANEGEPGPFYLQGDHTGGLKYRNITISVPRPNVH